MCVCVCVCVCVCSKIAFKQLKQGLGPQLADKVAKMHDRCSGRLCNHRQERREQMIQQGEEDLWDLHFDADTVRESKRTAIIIIAAH